MAAARNKPKWREAADRIRLKRKGGRLGTGPCPGDAVTKPNTVEGSPPTWRWKKENPDNFTVINEEDFNPEGDYNPPDPGSPPKTPSDAVQDAMLSSALLHEDCHSNQDGEQTDKQPVSKHYYQREYEAHRLQVEYLNAVRAWLRDTQQLQADSPDDRRLMRYINMVERAAYDYEQRAR